MTPYRLTSANAQIFAALSDLCLRSKAHWGYPPELLEAHSAALTVTATDLQDAFAIVGAAAAPAGLVQVQTTGDTASLDKLFVDPDRLGQGIGAVLFGWAVGAARAQKAARLIIDSDPQAQGFYERMGATLSGHVPSPPPAGRTLPQLTLPL